MTEPKFSLPLAAGGQIALIFDSGGVRLLVEAEAPAGGTRDLAQPLMSPVELRALAALANAVAMQAETLAVSYEIAPGCTLGQGGPTVCTAAMCPCSLMLAGAS